MKSKNNWGVEHAVFAGATLATVVGAVTGRERLQQVAKPLIAPALAARVLRRRADTDPADVALLLAGLTAATVGDVFMIDPDDDARLVRGASSFAVMQIGYSTLLLRRGARATAPALLPRLAGWAGAAALLRGRAKEVAVPLTAYGSLLGTTSTLSADPTLAPGAAVVANVAVPGTDRRSWLGAGGMLFTASDGLIVLRRLFIRGERGRAVAEGVILASYAAAQLLLVEGMLALGRRRITGRA
ncbi:lysoplasmalogenase family protein [Rhodococcus sp. NPDC127530]|uniref:lysoplasmalogenase family protein n=1 Tax=unclassified Rhodococcus (in: high G+C Gram-positive bacteria) TaxID=192944 RepID=UPI0036274597